METSPGHLSVLVEAGRLLGSSLDYALTLQQLADLVVPRLADWCTVDVAQPDGTLSRVAAAHRDPGRAAELRQLGQQFPISTNADHPVAQALRTGEVVFLPAIGDAEISRGAPSPARRARLAALGIGSAIAVPLVVRDRILGVLSLARIDQRDRYTSLDVTVAQALGQRAAVAIDNARLYAAEQDARARAEAANRRIAFLAEVSARLSSSLDAPATVASVARAAVPAMADWCIIDLVDPVDHLGQVLVAHTDPSKEAMVARLRQRYPPDFERPTGIGHTMRTGEAEFHPNVTDAILVAGARDAEHLALLRELGLRSVMFLALTGSGEALGGLTLATGPSGRTYTEDDLHLAEEVARRAALALHNARLYSAAQKETDRIGRLQQITAGLAAALTAEEVAEVIVNHAVPALGANTGVVAALSPDGQYLEVLRAVGFPPAVIDPVRHLPLTLVGPVTDAVRRGEPVWIESPDELRRRFPSAQTIPSVAFNQAWTAIPLIARGRILGALALSFAAPRTIRPAERAYIETLARECAQALERAQLYEAERDARAVAQAALTVRDEFLSVAAHELKTPVAALRLVVQLALRRISRHGPFDAEIAASTLRTLDQQTERLTRLTNQLLDVTRLETGRLRLDCQPTDAVALVRRVVDTLATNDAQNRIRLDGSPALVLEADPLRLEQVVSNLVDNALKHGGSGPIDITVHEDGSTVVMRVADHGPGVSVEHRAQLFERFSQLNERMSPTGLGLGLYLSRQIVERHGGTLTAEFPASGGATFVVRLPR
jgi:signal transduction histidine kinase